MNGPDTYVPAAVFSKQLNKLLDAHGVPASKYGRLEAFAKLVDRPVSTAHRWLTGKSIPDFVILVRLCRLFPCSLDELFGVEQTPSTNREQTEPTLTQRLHYLSENGGIDINIPGNIFMFPDPTKRVSLMTVSGTEMSGYVEPFDRVVFDPDETDIRSGSVFVLLIANRLVVRRLVVRLDQQIDVVCDNPRHPPERTSPDLFKRIEDAQTGDITVLGRVIAKINFERT